MTGSALYLYAVCRAGRERLRAGGASVGEGLRLVEHGDIAVIASPVGSLEVRMTPENLEAHERVVEEAARSGVVLPFRFGIVARSEAELVEQYLATNAATLRRSLDALDGLREVRVVARYREEVALREVLRADARVRRLQARIRSRPPDASYYDRIALGERVMGALAEVRERDVAMFAARLRPLARAERRLPSGGDDDGFRLAYLVDFKGADRFDTTLAALGREQERRMDITLLGPLAPWDFVDLEMEAQWAS